MNVIGLDPGFASFGVAVVNLLPDREIVEEMVVIRTQKSAKKKNVKAVDDNFLRACQISSELRTIIETLKPVAMVAESKSDPRNASVAGKVSMAWGVLADIAVDYRISMIQASPQEIKKVLCGNKSATKTDVQDEIEARYDGTAIEVFKKQYPAGQWEHGFDAVGAVVACLDDPVLQMVRRMG